MAVYWRPIPGHPGYEASSDGRLRSWRRYSNGRELTPTLESNGYYKQRLRTAHASQWVHRLIAAAFLGPCPDGMEVRHLDGNPRNNAAANLAYGTSSDNKRDQVRHGTHWMAVKTECVNGHPYDAENTGRESGRRYCKTCRRNNKRATVQRQVGQYVACPECGADVSKLNLHRHIKTARCAERRAA